ncbi:MAG: hypothetical protein MUF42_12540 [Cytophagaceae bacterium]|jgi:hypothetical protein|nr:hypothetical protein [Cytophagaceae bacterium]
MNALKLIFWKLLATFIFLGAGIMSMMAGVPGNEVKRYIRPSLSIQSYRTPWRDLQNDTLSQYRFRQNALAFYTPVWAHSRYKRDSITLQTFHGLFTLNTQTSRPHFKGLDRQEQILKAGIGIRLLITSGKNTWMYQLVPFFAQDRSAKDKPVWRTLSSLVFNRTVSASFAYRLGITRTFLFGNRFTLPLIGFRFGAMDRTHFLFQFPRNMQLKFPMGKKHWGNVFLKPNGNISTIQLQDSISRFVPGQLIQIRRNEMNLGFEWFFRLRPGITMQLALGIAGRRRIALAEETQSGTFAKAFYTENIARSGFLSLGFSFRFGKSKNIDQHYTLYDALNTMHTLDPGNAGPSDDGIPAKNSDLKKIQFSDLQDLLEEE